MNTPSSASRRIGVVKGKFKMPVCGVASACEVAALFSAGLHSVTSAQKMPRMFSVRFSRPIVVTRHATQRMAERQIDSRLLHRIIDEGELRYSSHDRLWAWLEIPGRADNLLCAALVVDDAVVVKTVMHRWELMP